MDVDHNPQCLAFRPAAASGPRQAPPSTIDLLHRPRLRFRDGQPLDWSLEREWLACGCGGCGPARHVISHLLITQPSSLMPVDERKETVLSVLIVFPENKLL
jgi:hypothetical protein